MFNNLCSLILCLLLGFGAVVAQNTYVPNEVIIKFGTNATSTQIQDLFNDLGVDQAMTISDSPKTVCWTFDQLPIVIPPDNNRADTTFLETIAQVVGYSNTSRADVDGTDLNYQLQKSSPTAYGLPQTVDIHNYDPLVACPNYPGQLYGATGTYGPKIAIIDTGYDFSLLPAGLDSIVAGTYNVIDSTTNVADQNGHGTNIAGMIAAGCLSAGLTNAQLYIIKAFNANGEAKLSDLLMAVDYAKSLDVDLINCSWGYHRNLTAESGVTVDPLLKTALRELADSNDIKAITSAGNDGSEIFSEGYIPGGIDVDLGIVSLAATNQDGDSLASFSNYSTDFIDIAAPGKEILAPNQNGNWVYYDGSSYATALATIVAAQIVSFYGAAPENLHKLLNDVITQAALQTKISSGGVIDMPSSLPAPLAANPEQGNREDKPKGAKTEELSIQPNPFTSALTITFEAKAAGEANILIRDWAGRLVFSQQDFVEVGLNQFELSLHLSKGTYFATIKTELQEITKQIIRID